VLGEAAETSLAPFAHHRDHRLTFAKAAILAPLPPMRSPSIRLCARVTRLLGITPPGVTGRITLRAADVECAGNELGTSARPTFTDLMPTNTSTGRSRFCECGMEKTAIRGGDNDSMTTWLPLASTRRSSKGRAERDDGSNPCLLFGPSPSLVAEHWLVIAEKWASGHSSSSIAASFLPSCAHEWGCHSVNASMARGCTHWLLKASLARHPHHCCFHCVFDSRAECWPAPQRE
jgi:hypothetical protein